MAEDRREYMHNYYLKHRDKELEQCRVYKQTKRGKEVALKSLKKRRLNNPLKFKARDALNNAVFSGKIKRLPCEICGNIKSEAHHKDYTKLLKVRWLCSYHHRALENRLVAERCK